MVAAVVAQHYDWKADVLTVRLLDLPPDFSVQTPSGFVVHYSRPAGRPVRLEVRDYYRRFQGRAQSLRIDVDPPFEVSVGAVDLPVRLAAHVVDFDRAMSLLEGTKSPSR